jgi:hypothetical protein
MASADQQVPQLMRHRGNPLPDRRPRWDREASARGSRRSSNTVQLRGTSVRQTIMLCRLPRRKSGRVEKPLPFMPECRPEGDRLLLDSRAFGVL